MVDMNKTSWKLAAAALIWLVVAVWCLVALFSKALGGVLAALSFGAIASMLLTGYSSSDVNKL